MMAGLVTFVVIMRMFILMIKNMLTMRMAIYVCEDGDRMIMACLVTLVMIMMMMKVPSWHCHVKD